MKSKMLSPVLRSGCLTSKNVSQKVTQLPQLGGNHAALSVKMYSTSHSQLASTSAPPDAAAAPDVGSVVPKPSQAFVKARFKPGEWDLEFKDPLYRPNFFGNAKILAAEDFHARPKVGTSDSFANFTEAMSTPCWMTRRQMENMYQMYTEIILHSASAHNGVTSHEYAVRAVAHRFHVIEERAAAVLQLMHNEQQIIREGGQLWEDFADLMEYGLLRELIQAYQTNGQRPPDSFIEDPMGYSPGSVPSAPWKPVEDVVSIEKIWPDQLQKEDMKAQVYLDGYVYEVDKEHHEIDVPLDDDCNELMRRAKQLAKKQVGTPKSSTHKHRKFCAQIVNTRKLREKNAKDTSYSKFKHKLTASYTNNSPRNTLVVTNDPEESIRGANLEEVEGLAWKPIRNTKAFIYRPLQKAWLKRFREGDTEAWGKVTQKKAVTPEELVKEYEKEHQGEHTAETSGEAAEGEPVEDSAEEAAAAAASDDEKE